jgi:hypothetical protein
MQVPAIPSRTDGPAISVELSLSPVDGECRVQLCLGVMLDRPVTVTNTVMGSKTVQYGGSTTFRSEL